MWPLGTLFRRRGLGVLGPDRRDERDYDLDKLGLGSVSDDGPYTLEKFDGPVLNQLGTQSCVAHAVLDGEVTAQSAAHGRSMALGSRLAGYYNSRRQHQRPVIDDGTYIRLFIKALARFGIAEEKGWPFDPWKINVQPDLGIYLKGHARRGIRGYYRIYDVGATLVSHICASVRSGRPTVFGIRVDQAFIDDKGPDHISYPFVTPIRGGHALEILGYKRESGRTWFRIKNSWGSTWRDGGYAWLEETAVRAAWDHWVIDPEAP